MNPIRTIGRLACILAGLAAASALATAASAGATGNAAVAATGNAAVALPAGNTVAQWNKIAEDTVVGSGAFQAEGLIYMAYVSAAVYDAVAAIEGGFAPYGPRSPPRRGRRPTQRPWRPPTGRSSPTSRRRQGT
jgi:hypothetical protein